MNLIEAIKTGRPFKCRHWGGDMWCHVVQDGRDGRAEVQFVTDKTPLHPFAEDLKDEWEIQEKAVTITQSQFWEAWGVMLAEERGMRYGDTQFHVATRNPKHLGTVLAHKLGLGEP